MFSKPQTKRRWPNGQGSIQSCAVNDLWQMVAWLTNAGLPLVARVHWLRSGQ